MIISLDFESMNRAKNSSVIYGDAPFIEDMGVLTTLCLLNDEVLLFGNKSLGDHLEDYWAKGITLSNGDSQSVVEQTFQILQPEGVVSFLSPADAAARFPEMDDLEIPGIDGVETINKDGKSSVALKINKGELNNFSKMVLHGTKKGQRRVSDLIRDISLFGTAVKSGIPIICEYAHMTLTPSSTYVSEVASFLAHKTVQRLALPELRAYHAEDILEARIKLKSEILEFKASILDLVWELHKRVELNGDQRSLFKECDILIDTKITSAILQLENAISSHENNKIRRILKTTGGVVIELGKSLLTPNMAGALMGGSSALLKLAESMEKQPPTMQVASFIYKVRDKRF